MNHLTVGVYPNGEFKKNVVDPKHLDDHLEYNDKLRPGRAFFLDGKCIHDGFFMNKEAITEWEEKIQNMNINMAVPTTPYV